MRTLITIIAFLSLGFLPEMQTQESVDIITPEKFCETIKTDDDVQVLDVRTAKEYESGHIKNSLNIDFFAADFKEQLSDQLSKNDNILVYCRSGNRSGKAYTILHDLGFKNVSDLKGGMLLWEKSKTDCH